MEKPIVKLEGIVKRYGNLDVVNHIDLEVKQGEFLTLLGPSGCGKTTTLRMIAGFEEPTSGIVWINDENVNKVEPYHREINTVFQSYSLFPHMTIFDNVAFGLKMKKVKRAEIKERVMEVLRLVQLDHLKNRKPEQLSGGQKQRIAIARAIVNNPEVLLLDEPLGALDLKLRKQMQLELKHLQQSLGITFIYVTHDQEEALTMSDRVVVMNEGRIEQIDEPRHIYQKPNSLFVANFIGETNILDGRVVAGHQKQLQVQVGDNMLPIKDQDLVEGESVHVSVRPECISIVDEEEAKNATNIFKVIVSELIYTGASTKIVTELSDGQKLVVQMNNGHQVEEGGTIYIKCEEEKCIIYKSETEEAIPS